MEVQAVISMQRRHKKNEQATITGKSIPMHKITLEVPADSPIRSGLKKMGVKEKQALTKLHDVAYYIALKGRPFTDFKDLIDLEKLHGVKFQSGAYENETSCRDFIDSISEFLFKDNLYKKFLRVNFVAILCDGTTDASITEQEVDYVFFVGLGLEDSRDANGIFEAIKKAFEKRNLLALLDKIIFLSFDGASVNSSKKSGLISLFREEKEWVTFIWCFSHRLELALKDALKDSIALVDETTENQSIKIRN